MWGDDGRESGNWFDDEELVFGFRVSIWNDAFRGIHKVYGSRVAVRQRSVSSFCDDIMTATSIERS